MNYCFAEQTIYCLPNLLPPPITIKSYSKHPNFQWIFNYKFNKDFHPSVFESFCNKLWYLDGQYHNTKTYAVFTERFVGYYRRGVLHRPATEGPAALHGWSNDYYEWGKLIRTEHFDIGDTDYNSE